MWRTPETGQTKNPGHQRTSARATRRCNRRNGKVDDITAGAHLSRDRVVRHYAARLRINAALVRKRPKTVSQPYHRLGAAQHQEAVALGDAGDTLQHANLGGLIEIDQYIAAQHQIEAAEMAEVVEQIERQELHHAADLRRNLPSLANLGEILDQHQRRQTTLHLELAVDAALGLFQHLGGKIGRNDLDPPTTQILAHLLQRDGKRIRFLAGGGGGTPDANAPARGARSEQRRHDGLAEMVERYLVAEEKRFVRRHRLDHFNDQRLAVGTAQLGNEAG